MKSKMTTKMENDFKEKEIEASENISKLLKDNRRLETLFVFRK